MLRRKSNGQKEPQEIRIRYEANRMVFAIGGQEFFLSKEACARIFDKGVAFEFERASAKGETLEKSLSTYVRIGRLLRKGLGLPEVALVLGVPEPQVRQFYSAEIARPRVEKNWDSNMIEIERERQAGSATEMDFVKERDREMTQAEQRDGAKILGEQFIDLRTVKNLRSQGMSDDKMAEHLGLDKKEFGKFLEQNRRYLELLQ